MVVLGRLDDAQRIVADGSKCWRALSPLLEVVIL
jgi:hypothetical protein